MATKLQCPQCKRDLPANANPGVCPACTSAGTTTRPKTVRRQPTVVRAKAYRPPPIQAKEEGGSSRWIALVVALLLVAGGIGGFLWMKRSPGETQTAKAPDASAPADTNNPQVAAPNAPKTSTPGSSAPKAPAQLMAKAAPANDAAPKPPPTIASKIADDPTTVAPRPRAQVKIETAPEETRPAAFAEFTRPGAQSKKMAFSKSVDQDKVDKAIAQGISYLKANKGWTHQGNGGHALGYAALPALALLEVGVPKEDPIIQDALAAVRRMGPPSTETYSMSLAILFLDKYGDPADDPLIRKLGLRLVAGQTAAHGWNYPCPIVPAADETPLFQLLEKLRPEGQWQIPLGREPGKALIELAIPIAKGPERLTLELPLTPDSDKPAFEKREEGMVMPLMLGDAARTADILKLFPDSVTRFPAVQPLEATPVKPNANGNPKLMPKKNIVQLRGRGAASSRDDNSNSQFAMLALWAARRHGVPVERSLLLADQRYATSQAGDGSWAYSNHGAGTPQMTCVGLLGLALGHGALLSQDVKAPTKPVAADPAIQRGLDALGKHIGQPGGAIPGANLYYLWSLERVAMLYQLETIGGKDWYGWGANHLLVVQKTDGHWEQGHYPGTTPSLDTAFALLFLHRSNLVSDLTERLQLHMPLQDERK